MDPLRYFPVFLINIMDQNKSPSSGGLKKTITGFFNHPDYSLPVKLFFVSLGLCFLFLAIFFRKLPPLVPLYYSLPWGEEQLARPYELFFLPFSLIIFYLLNITIGIFFLKTDHFLIQILLWATCIFALIELFTLIKIIFLVI